MMTNDEMNNELTGLADEICDLVTDFFVRVEDLDELDDMYGILKERIQDNTEHLSNALLGDILKLLLNHQSTTFCNQFVETGIHNILNCG